jgi:hypothetical protein
MRTFLGLVVLITASCGPQARVPHYLSPDGEDLGAVVPATALASYYPPIDGVVSWAYGHTFLYPQEACQGAPALMDTDLSVDAVPHPADRLLYRVLAAEAYTSRSSRYVWQDGSPCNDFPEIAIKNFFATDD